MQSSRRVTRTFVQHIFATPEEVFPLLCPEREKEWLSGWDASMLFSASGIAEHGAVFETQQHACGRTLWVVTEYEPSRKIAFARWQPDGLIAHITITLGRHHDATTAACISYTYTAFDDAGVSTLAAMTEESWLHTMSFWQENMNTWLEKNCPSPPRTA